MPPQKLTKLLLGGVSIHHILFLGADTEEYSDSLD